MRFAQTAAIVGLVSAAVSVYWGLGGTRLLDTVGGSLAEHGRARDAGVVLAVWVAVGLKLIAVMLPLLAVCQWMTPVWDRRFWVLAWIAGGFLAIYGFVLTVAGLLVQTGVIHASANADHRALAWHAYLWDPWFLIWGLLIATALLRARGSRSRS